MGEITAGGTYRFQFHKGTIKTELRLKGYSNLSSFQFHKGTIKTGFPQTPVPHIIISIP